MRGVFEQLDALNAQPFTTLLVAYSGGLDSHSLLCLTTHWLESLPAHKRPELRAIHIDHGLHAASSDWAQRCGTVCRQLSVTLDIVRVEVRARGSLESAARSARYEIFENRLTAQGVLLQGHHLDDQAETILHRLVLGHGLQGLSGIPVSRVLGRGSLHRPFLAAGLGRYDVEQVEKRLVALGMPMHPVEDPSNTDTSFDRNYLRHAVLPTLLSRWPAARIRMYQSSQYLSDAAELCETLAELDLGRAAQGISRFIGSDYAGRLPLSELYPWPESRQRNLLRYWLKRQSLSLSEGAWAELLDVVERSASDSGQQAHFELAGDGNHDCGANVEPQSWCLSLYQQTLFVHQGIKQSREAGDHAGSLACFDTSVPDAGLWPMYSTIIAPQPGQVVSCRPRTGATLVKVAGRARTTTLKKLLSERRLLPWERDVLPLICYDGEPVCMPGVFVSAAYAPSVADNSDDVAKARTRRLLTVAWRSHGFAPAQHMVVIPPVIQ
ncbi:tRNA lysidine(34) synthetase TilS [Allohahella sp. A8]|uniref:tRNA lysidine(34) synthetase TilS n=1 Tax=Allohahella sp. A8 TaxID=3141461 RepID=UPI003A80FC43